MELQTQIKFANIYSKFYNEEHTPADVGKLIEILRQNKQSISDESKKLLLQIPLCVLKNQVEVKNVTDWASQNGHYFAGNYAQEPLHSRFESNNFDLNIMVDCLNEIISDSTKLHSDFHLRNPEVTLQHDVSIKNYSNFKESGKLFAHIMEKAFNC
ncbi:MAG: hypothetical protein NC251_01780 [Lachnoclostridium sp.]|nr:hypothetical protein [Lachnospira sp.]MCM1247138.1 hypothetical protein [Lachnoclostridium sp.]